MYGYYLCRNARHLIVCPQLPICPPLTVSYYLTLFGPYMLPHENWAQPHNNPAPLVAPAHTRQILPHQILSIQSLITWSSFYTATVKMQSIIPYPDNIDFGACLHVNNIHQATSFAIPVHLTPVYEQPFEKATTGFRCKLIHSFIVNLSLLQYELSLKMSFSSTMNVS